MEIFIVIPCYNESKRIVDVLEKTLSLKIAKKIIIVDDGSIDGSEQVIKNKFKDAVLLLKHKTNLGKGAALKTGCEAVLKLGDGIIVFMDGDGQHSPDVIPLMVKKLDEENLDIVFGSRKFKLNRMPLVFYLGNKFLSGVIKIFSGVYVSDSQSGLKVFKSAVYNKLCWSASDYSVETEIIMNTGKNKLKYGEVFIDTIYKDNYKGTTPFDGIKILSKIITSKFL